MRFLCSRLRDGGSLLCDANIHLSASGSNTSPYDTWAKAASSTTTAWADAITASAAGDDFYVDSALAVSNASAQTLTFKGTKTAPNRVFSCSTITHDAPTTADLGAGASFTTTGASGLTVNGSVYIYGVTFNVGTGSSAANAVFASADSEITLDTCAINHLVTTATCTTQFFSGAVNSKVTLINTPFTFNGGTASGIAVGQGVWVWRNTTSAILGTQSAIANLIQPASARVSVIIFDSVDFAGGTGIASGKALIAAPGTPIAVQMVNCKFTSGALISRPTITGATVDQIVTDSGATNYKQQRDTYQGTLTASTSVTNNATDGTTPISWQVITTANAKPQSPFECFQIVQWVAAGTYANSKVFITSATASLKTNDVWVEVGFLGSSYALGSPATSFGAGSGTATLPQIPAGTTPGTLAAASPAWTTGGLGNDYQLAIPSFTTSVAGYVRFTVKVGKASLTVNIDPVATVAA